MTHRTTAATALVASMTIAAPLFAGTAHVTETTYNTTDVDGVSIFYREAGPKDAPTVLLLHGFPSSSHMFRDLIPELAKSYHVVAPDYPGYGQSAAPAADAYDYDFATLATTMEHFTEQLGLDEYTLYMQDFGGPVGLRMIQNHPERLEGLIIQNATFHVEGWNPDVVKQFAPFWGDRNAETEAPLRQFLAPQTTEWQYRQGSTLADRLSPDAWIHDQAGLDRPGNTEVQLEYLWNYQDNVANYESWQNKLGELQPDTLIVWGENDPFFTIQGVEAVQKLLPNAETHLYDAGHFALETHADEISTEILEFLAR
ncbi:alpha/beta fold hydrolase [Epibacterium sp. SM1979]|uniref:Alpha/beta fold hydrolase n=1 Tax=Tritonibacter litoralis TaxID=2662264 RepID=A0A843YD61_9RHOB|nr:alpha/beta hydrolase [Tritonibacter litoralis]MQQ09300.1 alpha/beta fold hydrolase [Tritonibacter litoralis]